MLKRQVKRLLAMGIFFFHWIFRKTGNNTGLIFFFLPLMKALLRSLLTISFTDF